MKFFLILIIVITLTFSTHTQVLQAERKDEKTNHPMSAALMQAELTDTEGRMFRLDDIRGKVILLNIWAVWAGPSRDQMPHLVEIQNKYDRRDLEVIGINMGDPNGNPEEIRRIKVLADSVKVNYYLTNSTKTFLNDFYALTGQSVVPQTILIDRRGLVKAIIIGSGDRNNALMKSEVDKIVNLK